MRRRPGWRPQPTGVLPLLSRLAFRVFAYRFVSGESIEERIADLQVSKRKLADSIVSGSDSVIRGLSKDDLEYLFK